MLARCPWLSILVLSALPAAAQQGVTFENARFLDSFGQLTPLTTGTILDATSAGHWIAEFDFTSPLVNPTSGLYELRPMAVVWALTDEEGDRAPSHVQGGWQGIFDPAAEPIVLSFDRNTGHGRAQVSIPIATGLSSGRRHAGWATGPVLIDLAVGWRGEIGVNEQGALLSPLFVGHFVVDANAPQHWIDIEAPLVGVPAEFNVHVVSPLDVEVERTFEIQNPYPHALRFSDAPGASAVPVILAVGELMATVRMRAIGPGDYHLVLADSGGSQVDLSNRCSVDLAQFVLDVDLESFEHDGELAFGSSGGVIMHPPGWTPGQPVNGPAPSGTLTYQNKRCKPPADNSGTVGQTTTVCSGCGTSPQVNCGDSATFASPGTCTFDYWSICTKGGSTTITASTYTKTAGPYDTTLGCPSPKEGGLQLYKKCCDYKQTTGSSSVTMPNCS